MLIARLVAGSVLAGVVAGAAFGQTYPNAPIRIVTAPAGGGSDFIARIMAQGMAGPLGQQLIIDNRAGETVFTDGPFLESKEHIAGFWIIEAADLDVALRLAADGSKACNRKVEVRPLLAE